MTRTPSGSMEVTCSPSSKHSVNDFSVRSSGRLFVPSSSVYLDQSRPREVKEEKYQDHLSPALRHTILGVGRFSETPERDVSAELK